MHTAQNNITPEKTFFKKIDRGFKHKISENTDDKVARLKAESTSLFNTKAIKVNNFNVANLQRLKSLQEIQQLPLTNEHYRIVTHNSFNAYTWIDFFCQYYQSFEEVYISSYNLSEAAANNFFSKFDEQIFKRLSIIISESIRFRKIENYQQLEFGIKSRCNPNLKMAGIWNHSKIILMKPTKTEDFFIIEGSGNFTSNARIEQYSVDNNKQIYDFHKNWMEEFVFDKKNIELKRHFII